MERGNRVNIANGVISGIVLLCGIIFSILIGVMFNKLFSGLGLGSNISAYSGYASSPVWALGFSYMVPGLIGVIASAVAQKCGYITQMVFCILTLVCMAIFFVVGLLALTAMSLLNTSLDGCVTNGETCECRSSLSGTSFGSSGTLTTSYSLTCEDLSSIYGMSAGAVAMMVLGWIFTLVTTIIAGILACKREPQPAIVYQPQTAPTVVQMGQMPPGGYIQQGGYAQPAYPPQQTGYVAQTNEYKQRM